MVYKLVTVYSIIRYVCAMLAIAFFTLLERKILGYRQLRKGPNKISFIGFLQPIADAIKLFTKEAVLLKKKKHYHILNCPDRKTILQSNFMKDIPIL